MGRPWVVREYPVGYPWVARECANSRGSCATVGSLLPWVRASRGSSVGRPSVAEKRNHSRIRNPNFNNIFYLT